MPPQTETAWLATGLEALARRQLGETQVSVSELRPLSGHAGLGYSFLLSTPQGGRRLVVRTVAEGVPAKGPSDVVRQARIMQSMAASGVPVPQIIWTEDASNPELGRPYFVAEFVDGYQTPEDWRNLTEKDSRLARRAMAALPLIHKAPWRQLEDIWGPCQELEEEFERLQKLFDRPTIDLAEGGRVTLLRDRLMASLPQDVEIGCVHGDFHWGNVIFGEDEVRAIVDWEISFVGPTLLDVGWIAFYADTKAFTGPMIDRPRRFGLTPEEMVDCYEVARGERSPPAQVAWFRAFSAYRFGVISLFNAMLHRRGKRHDPMWEEMIVSVPQMMERGLELIAAAPGRAA